MYICLHKVFLFGEWLDAKKTSASKGGRNCFDEDIPKEMAARRYDREAGCAKK